MWYVHFRASSFFNILLLWKKSHISLDKTVYTISSIILAHQCLQLLNRLTQHCDLTVEKKKKKKKSQPSEKWPVIALVVSK